VLVVAVKATPANSLADQSFHDRYGDSFAIRAS